MCTQSLVHSSSAAQVHAVGHLSSATKEPERGGGGPFAIGSLRLVTIVIRFLSRGREDIREVLHVKMLTKRELQLILVPANIEA